MVKKLLFVLLLFAVTSAKAQNYFFDDIQLMNEQKNKQLLGDSIHFNNKSFIIRSTSAYQYNLSVKRPKHKFFYINTIVAGYDFQNNSLLPVSYNDGNMFPSRGWQERYSVGANIHIGILDINFQPEKLSLENKRQELFLGDMGNYWAKYYQIAANYTSHFRSFGNERIDTTTFGQTRVGISTKKIALGVSNQNLWWGPGSRNSLLMTNNAAGFKHLYINTNEPIKTSAGTFEFNAIVGTIDTTRYVDPDDSLMRTICPGCMVDKNINSRTIKAITVIWQPKWIPNFYLGYAYSKQYYDNDSTSLQKNTTFFPGDRKSTTIGSLYFRFLMPKDHLEFYGEIGQQNETPWLWNFFKKSNATAFIIGSRKLFPIKSNKSYIELELEFAQLQLMNPRLVFTPGDAVHSGPQVNSWYTSNIIRQGYTNNGQLLGASIGPGSNSQTFGVAYHLGMNKIKYGFERVVNNNDFYHFNTINFIGAAPSGYYDRYYADVNHTIEIQIMPIKNFLFSASLVSTNALNYRWIRRAEDIEANFLKPSPISDKQNTRINLSFKYVLHGVIK
jgi:hypothetical protein